MKYFIDSGKGFTTELGLPSPLIADSIRSMMASQDQWPFNDVWAYHDWCSDGAMGTGSKYMDVLTTQYGAPADLADFRAKGPDGELRLPPRDV